MQVASPNRPKEYKQSGIQLEAFLWKQSKQQKNFLKQKSAVGSVKS